VSEIRKEIEKPIVAIALEDNKGEFHFINCSLTLYDLDMQDDITIIKGLSLPHAFFKSIIMCTKEMLDELKEKLQIA
jgi:hypothetical protein